MSDEKLYEITIDVRGTGVGDEATRHLEGTLDRKTAADVASSIVDGLSWKSGKKVTAITDTDR